MANSDEFECGDLERHINQTASALVELRDGIIWVKTDLSALNASIIRMSDIVEKNVTTYLDHNLTRVLAHILDNTYGYVTISQGTIPPVTLSPVTIPPVTVPPVHVHMWRYRRLETCSLSGYDRPQYYLSIWME